MHRSLVTATAAALLVAGCAAQQPWTPVVDTYRDSRAQYLSRDMEECRNLALRASGLAPQQGVLGAVAGGLVGAAAGAATGGIGAGLFAAGGADAGFKRAYIGHDDEFAVARVKFKTTGKAGTSFVENIVDSMTVFHQENGQWKFWNQLILGVATP